MSAAELCQHIEKVREEALTNRISAYSGRGTS